MIRTKDELVAYIQKAHQQEKKTFREIHQELKRLYKSPKTSVPLSETSIRQIAAKAKQMERVAGESPKLLGMIENILDIDGMPAQAKIDLINQLRRGIRT